jgi:hypothetical protein
MPTYTATGLVVTGPSDPQPTGTLLMLVAGSPGVIEVPPGAVVEVDGIVNEPPYAALLHWFGRQNPCRVDVSRGEDGSVAGVRFMAGA